MYLLFLKQLTRRRFDRRPQGVQASQCCCAARSPIRPLMICYE